MIAITSRNTPKLPDWHLNRRWTLADVWAVERKAANRASASEIAKHMGCERIDILRLCHRNGIKLWSLA